ncbi:doenitin-1-like isoform X2 [Erythrolamprus reginae]
MKGKCKAFSQRFYYDYKKKSCQTFVYGGCQGNRNRFVTLKNCIRTCKRFDKMETTNEGYAWKKFIDERCTKRPRAGYCFYFETRFYYDDIELRCKAFNYNGCGGNANNYETYRECVEACDVFAFDPEYASESS